MSESFIHTDEFRMELVQTVGLLLIALQQELERLRDEIVENNSSKYD